MLNLYDGLICCRMMSLVPDVTLFIPVSASFGSFNPKLKINILKKKKISPVIGKKKKKGFFFFFFFFSTFSSTTPFCSLQHSNENLMIKI